MSIFCISLAGVCTGVTAQYEYLPKLLADYQSTALPLFQIALSDEDIAREREKADGRYSAAYLESLAFYRHFCTQAANYGVILFHGCALEYNGKAYIFAAPSGTGKSTHANLWMNLPKDGIHILNGDKPLIRFQGQSPFVYGTPFTGKEGWGYPGCAPLGGLCFLHCAKENTIVPISPHEALAPAYVQLFKPEPPEAMRYALDCMLAMLNCVPLWSLGCNMDPSAAEVSFKAMTGEPI